MEQHNTSEREKISLQEKWDAEKAELQQSKEQLLAEKLEIKELVNRALLSVTSSKYRQKNGFHSRWHNWKE
jgi:hypothetical protein